MTYPPAKPPTSTPAPLVWVAAALAALGVVLGIAAIGINTNACKAEQQTYRLAVSFSDGVADASAKLAACERKTSEKVAPLATGAAMALVAGALMGGSAYLSSDGYKRSSEERKRQRAWAAYNAAQQAAQRPEPVYDYPTEEPTVAAPTSPQPAPEPVDDLPWYLRGDKQ